MTTTPRHNRWPSTGLGRLPVGLAVLLGAVGITDIVWAHDLSQRYDLPAPLWLYTFTVMAAVIASVAMVDALVRGTTMRLGVIVLQPRLDLRHRPIVRWLFPPIALGGLSVGVFVVLLIMSSAGYSNSTPEGFNVFPINQARPVRITMPPRITFERCLILTPAQTLSYWFQADQPLVFDIHYHAQNVRYYGVEAHLAKREQRMYTPPSTQEYCLTWQNPASAPVALSWAFAATRAHPRVVLTP